MSIDFIWVVIMFGPIVILALSIKDYYEAKRNLAKMTEENLLNNIEFYLSLSGRFEKWVAHSEYDLIKNIYKSPEYNIEAMPTANVGVKVTISKS